MKFQFLPEIRHPLGGTRIKMELVARLKHGSADHTETTSYADYVVDLDIGGGDDSRCVATGAALYCVAYKRDGEATLVAYGRGEYLASKFHNPKIEEVMEAVADDLRKSMVDNFDRITDGRGTDFHRLADYVSECAKEVT